MKYRLVHTNHLGQIYSEHGNSCRRDTTAQMEFMFETLDAARQHAQAYVRRFPELQCEIHSEDGTVQECIRDEQAQTEFVRQYCTVPKRDQIRDAILATVFVASLVANVVMAFLLLRRL
jgi:hypothetical protein